MTHASHRAIRPRPRRAALALSIIALLTLAACAREDNASPRDDSSGGAVAAGDGSAASGQIGTASAKECESGNGGITLPTGFCAAVFADAVGGARHISVAPNGDVFVALQTSRRGAESGAGRGGVLALRDTNHDGRADLKEYFGVLGGTGIQRIGNWLYADGRTAIVRYPMRAGELRPTGAADTVVTGLPTGGHEAHSLVIDARGNLFVNFGSETNSCQREDRQDRSPGIDPCTQLEQRAGIWRFDANGSRQAATAGERWATGIRNAVGIGLDAGNQLWAAQHGRDQLYQNWQPLYTAAQSAELPAEELLRVEKGDDFGWPYCYFDQTQHKRVLAPEYGGNGGREVGRCAGKKNPVVAFPGHWAPNGLAFYTGAQFPARYRNGVFIAFHGSWNRAPLPQQGYRVVFVPLDNGRPSGNALDAKSGFETFADGFVDGTIAQPGEAEYRPGGLAVAPDGALFIADDKAGRIWRVVYTGAR